MIDLKNLWQNFFSSLNKQSKTVASAAAVLAIASILSGLLGIFRDRLLAGTFGAGDALDVYYAAFRLPDFLYSVLIFGALSGGFIPVFTAYLKKNNGGYEATEEGWQVVNIFLNFFFLGFLFLCLAGIVFAPGIFVFLTPGFTPEKIATGANLMRIIFAGNLLLALAGVFGSVLQSFKRFFIYAIAPLFYNIGIILGVLFFAKKYGISSAAIGVFIGAFLYLAIQAIFVFSIGYRYRAIFDFYHGGFLKIIKLMVPRSLGLGVLQLNYIMMTIIASGLVAGSLAIYSLAYNVVTLPIGIFGASFAVAAFPSLCEAFHEKNKEKFKQVFSFSFRQIVFLTMPIAFFLIVLRLPIVQSVFEAGKFGQPAALITADVLRFFALSVLFESLVTFLIRAYLALEDSLTPFFILLFGTAVRLGVAFLVAGYMGPAGLALAFTIGSIVNFLLLWVFLKKKAGAELGLAEIAVSSLKIFFISLSGALSSVFVLFTLKSLFVGDPIILIFGQGLVASVIGILVFVFLSWLLRMPEAASVWEVFKNRLPWAKIPAEAVGPVEVGKHQ